MWACKNNPGATGSIGDATDSAGRRVPGRAGRRSAPGRCCSRVAYGGRVRCGLGVGRRRPRPADRALGRGDARARVDLVAHGRAGAPALGRALDAGCRRTDVGERAKLRRVYRRRFKMLDITPDGSIAVVISVSSKPGAGVHKIPRESIHARRGPRRGRRLPRRQVRQAPVARREGSDAAERASGAPDRTASCSMRWPRSASPSSPGRWARTSRRAVLRCSTSRQARGSYFGESCGD